MPVQHHVRQARLAEQAVQVVGVAQVLLVKHSPADHVVVHGRQPQPSSSPVVGQSVDKPP
jgi:hypothetical protein